MAQASGSIETKQQQLDDTVSSKSRRRADIDSTALYGSVFENTSTALVVMEADKTISMVNREFENLSGLSREAIEWKLKWTKFVHPEDLDRMTTYHHSRGKEGAELPNVYEFRFISDRGELRHILLRVGMIPGTQRRIGSLIDITPRKKAEKALLISERKYRSILESIGEGYCELDLQGNFTFVNDSMCRITGFTRSELLRMNNREYASPETAQEMFRIFNEVFRTGQSSRVSRFEVGLADRSAHLEMVVSCVSGEDGRPVGFRGLVRDVTERVNAEAKRIEFDRLQGVIEMAGAICHELNQPLQSIMGYSQLLQLDMPAGFSGADYVQKIANQVDRLKDITGKLMRITRYETVEYLNGSKIVDIDRSSADRG